MSRILPLGGKYGGFDTWDEWRKDLEKEGRYDPVLVALEARTEAVWAKWAGIVGAVLSAVGILVSIFVTCQRQ